MSIQANINQITSLAALMLTQTPQYKAAAEKRTELRKIKQEEKTLAKREELGAGKDPRLTQEIKEAQFNLAERKYKTDPTAANYEAKAMAATAKAEGEANVASLNRMEIQKAKGDFEDPREKLTEVPAAYDEAGNPVRYYTQGELDDLVAAQEANQAMTPAEANRAKADQSLAAEQANKRITRERTSFTSQRYGSWGRTDNKAFKGGSR